MLVGPRRRPGAQLERGQKHRARLAVVNGLERGGAGALESAGQVVGLAAHQLRGARGFRQHGTGVRRDVGGPHVFGQDLESQGQQRVAGQNRRRFAERLVTGGPAAAHVVVVHGRQVVVDQRIGVHHLDGAGRRQGRRGRAAAAFGRQQHQHRPQPLAGRQQAIADRLAERRRAATVEIRILAKRSVHPRTRLLAVILERENDAFDHRTTSNGGGDCSRRMQLADRNR